MLLLTGTWIFEACRPFWSFSFPLMPTGGPSMPMAKSDAGGHQWDPMECRYWYILDNQQPFAIVISVCLPPTISAVERQVTFLSGNITTIVFDSVQIGVSV